MCTLGYCKRFHPVRSQSSFYFARWRHALLNSSALGAGQHLGTVPLGLLCAGGWKAMPAQLKQSAS